LIPICRPAAGPLGQGIRPGGRGPVAAPGPRRAADGDQVARRLRAHDDRHACLAHPQPHLLGTDHRLRLHAFGVHPVPVPARGLLPGRRNGGARQLHAVLPPGGGVPARPGAGAGEVHAVPRTVVAVHQLFDVERRPRAVRSPAQIPLARHRTWHRRPAYRPERDTAPAPSDGGAEADVHRGGGQRVTHGRPTVWVHKGRVRA
jgi:hypothetical protein